MATAAPPASPVIVAGPVSAVTAIVDFPAIVDMAIVDIQVIPGILANPDTVATLALAAIVVIAHFQAILACLVFQGTLEPVASVDISVAA